nr:MAG TPA: hypothetical protein [Bacteriophage sp.]
MCSPFVYPIEETRSFLWDFIKVFFLIIYYKYEVIK